MITLAATARFFDPDDALADDRHSASFLLGDPDDQAPVYSCLIDATGSQGPEPGGASRVVVRLPMLTSIAVREPALLWRGVVVGELTGITVLPAEDLEPDQVLAELGAERRW